MLFVRTVGGKLSGWTRNDTTPVLRSALNTIALRLSPCWISGVSRPLACSFSLNFWIFFIIGVVLNAAAQNLSMLIIGRIFLGCGVGINQVQLHSIRSSVVQLICICKN
ncbi:sugar transport protein MST7-like isoform X2 [Magnolia sinica]|uniref:sugar transport protein MST7-like isoform X2 n=1 Tax=Magnolia sinica TaxID=86752 RepID=UPI00265ACC01|nr:sugar transport protein MST7-like isoform X2 [Magnolia sinica]